MQRMIPIAAALAVSCASGLSDVTAAHNEECEGLLREAPIETVSPPDGWTWDTLAWNYGLWTGSVTDADEDSYDLTILSITCSQDAAADLVRKREVRDALDPSPGIPVIPIGDEVDAFLEADRPQIVWRKGDAIASLDIDGQADYAAFEEFATAIDEVLP